MLRITIEEGCEVATMRLEGDLAGPWVAELERCWHSTLAGSEKRGVRVELDRVSYVDAAGRALLREMDSAGTQLAARGALTSYLVEQIRQRRAG